MVSEGEQRCISIAAFFAELSTADDLSGIVFDDLRAERLANDLAIKRANSWRDLETRGLHIIRLRERFNAARRGTSDHANTVCGIFHNKGREHASRPTTSAHARPL